MHGCCVADLNPWTRPSEMCGCCAGAAQQQGTTGLGVDQQLQQSSRRLLLQLNWALQPSPGSPVGGGERAGDAPFEQLKRTGVGRDGRAVELDADLWMVLEHLSQMPQQAKPVTSVQA